MKQSVNLSSLWEKQLILINKKYVQNFWGEFGVGCIDRLGLTDIIYNIDNKSEPTV